MSAYLVSSVVDAVLCECKYSDIKFYGESKCHPDDGYSEAIGKHIDMNRLLDKYLRVRDRIAKRIKKAVYKDCYSLGKLIRKKG